MNVKLLPRAGPRPLLVLGLALGGGTMLWLTQLEPSSYARAVLPALVVIGVGKVGTNLGSTLAGPTCGVDSPDSDVASAVVDVFTQVGALVGLAAPLIIN